MEVITIEDVRKWLDITESTFASNASLEKRLTATHDGFLKVYYKDKLELRTRVIRGAVEHYNRIK